MWQREQIAQGAITPLHHHTAVQLARKDKLNQTVLKFGKSNAKLLDVIIWACTVGNSFVLGASRFSDGSGSVKISSPSIHCPIYVSELVNYTLLYYLLEMSCQSFNWFLSQSFNLCYILIMSLIQYFTNSKISINMYMTHWNNSFILFNPTQLII